MERCNNCSAELVEKKYNRFKRIKCMSCGFETSKREEEEETLEFLKTIEESNAKHYPQNNK